MIPGVEEIIQMLLSGQCAPAQAADWINRHIELAAETSGVVYPPDGTTAPFTVINLGSGGVVMGDCVHDKRLPALWFGTGGKGMGHEEAYNREAQEGETLAVVTFANVDGLDVLLDVVKRIRRESFADAV